MIWLDWLRRKASGTEALDTASATSDAASPDEGDLPEHGAADPAAEVVGLDFYSAIGAHQRWKNRLRAAVTGQGDEALVAEHVARTDACALGQWLATLPANLPGVSTQELAELRELHTQFHAQAAEIVRLSDAGYTERALAALRTDAPYIRTSHRLTRLLSRIDLDLCTQTKPPFNPQTPRSGR